MSKLPAHLLAGADQELALVDDRLTKMLDALAADNAHDLSPGEQYLWIALRIQVSAPSFAPQLAAAALVRLFQKEN